jgi:hypothetical protein
MRGRSDLVDGEWTNSGVAGCANVIRLYCFEQ